MAGGWWACWCGTGALCWRGGAAMEWAPRAPAGAERPPPEEREERGMAVGGV
jgi:hypothetical protein